MKKNTPKTREPKTKEKDESIEVTSVVPDDSNLLKDIHNLNVLEILRATRLSKKISPTQAANHLNIQREYLNAVEEGDLTRLPERVYVLGYVRMYANYLGLDAEEITTEYKKTILRTPEEYHYEVLKPLPEGGVPKGSIIIASLGLLAAVYFGWQYISDTSNQPLVHKKQVASEDEDLLSSLDSMQTKDSPVDLGVEDDSSEEDDELNATEEENKDAALTRNGAFINPQRAEAAVVSVENANASSGSPRPEKVSAENSKKIKITAKERSWVEVRDKDGEILYSGIMKKGEEFEPKETENLFFSTGNAGGVVFKIGTQQIEEIGKTGQVIRRIPLAVEPLINMHKKNINSTE